MTTTERGDGPHNDPRAGDELRLRLPNAQVVLRGPLPPSVRDALADLTDPGLHLAPDAAQVLLSVREREEGWLIESARESPTRVPSVATGPGDPDLLDALVGRLNRLSFDTDPSRLHLHAAAVELDGVGILLAGTSGSGKSTVALELLRRGGAYLTDENLTVQPGSSTVFAYPKPLTLKRGSLDRAAEQPGHPAHGLPTAHNGRAHLRASTVGSGATTTRIGVIVVVRHAADEPGRFTPITAAEVCVRLLADTLDGVRLGPAALDVVAPLVAGATAWEFVYDDATTAAELIADLRPPLRHQLAVLHRSDPSPLDPVDGPALAQADPKESGDRSIRVARFDDGAVRHSGGTWDLTVLEPEELSALETTGCAEVPDPFAPRAFGLPGRPVGDLQHATPLTAADVEAAVQGRCTGVLVDQLVRGRAATDDDVAERARQRHRAGQSTCALLERELPRVVDLLERAGVRPVVLKGPVSAHDGPLPVHFRDFGDLDLLVPPDRIDAAVDALLEAGFERCFPQVSPDFDRRFAKSITLRAPFSGDWGDAARPTFEVDLHRTLTPGPFGEVVPLAELHDAAVPVWIHRRWYRTLHPEHRFVHHCLHVVLGSPEPRLHSVRDLVLSAPRTPSGGQMVVETARRWSVVAVVQQALGVATATFPGSITPELAAAAEGAQPRRVERLYMASYHRPGRTYSLPALATLVALPTWADRRDLARTLVRHRRSRRAE